MPGRFSHRQEQEEIINCQRQCDKRLNQHKRDRLREVARQSGRKFRQLELAGLSGRPIGSAVIEPRGEVCQLLKQFFRHVCQSPHSFKNSASSITFTPSSFALSSFEPASAPARTKSVFLLTLPLTLPPRASIFAVASSRVMDGSVPVSTKVFPAKTPEAEAAARCAISLAGLIFNSRIRARTFFPAGDEK